MSRKLIYAAAAAVIVLTAAVVIGRSVVQEYRDKRTPSEVVMPLTEYYDIPDGEAMLIIDETVYDRNALWRNGTAYLDLDTVSEMYIHRFFWVEDEQLMIYTTPTEIFHFTPGQRAYTVNDEPAQAEYPVVELKDGEPYISVNYLENCGITYTIYHDPERVLITYSEESYLAADVTSETQIRVSQNIKADLLTTLEPGDTVRFIDGGGIRENGFVKVMSSDGVRGYILESALSDSRYDDPVFTEFEWPEYTHIERDERIYLGWQLLYTTDSIGYLKEAAERAPEMTVIAPTWFFLNDTEGNMKTYATTEYVDKAHELGLEVWATYKNDTIDGQFECTEGTHAVLSSTAARTALIENILDTVVDYNLDGINIDFEMLKLDSGVYFIQFLRELSVKCRLLDIILSVDNYVPENYNAYYDLAEQSEIIDYIIIMGYDQHYAGSGETGSVSALDWFSEALANTAVKADTTRVIMGVPFYTRLWKIVDGKIYVEETPNMSEAAKIVKNAGVTKEWKEKEGQYYAAWYVNGAQYKIWLEDAESLRAKVSAARAYDVAGIAAWKCGDEAKGTWAEIVDALEGELPAEEDAEGSEDKQE